METPMPDAAPDPARPMKWLAPMLLAKMDAPTSERNDSIWSFP